MNRKDKAVTPDGSMVYGLENQLHTARYCFHKVKCRFYNDAVQRGEMTRDQAAEMYRISMADYDRLVGAAGDGHSLAPNEADMYEGFPK